jgi:hypothetical protein
MEKISSYNIFNNLFRALFVYLLERLTKVILSTDDIVKNIVLYYFAGLIIGRVGSIIIEPLKKLNRNSLLMANIFPRAKEITK